VSDIDDEGVILEVDYSASTERERVDAADSLRQWISDAEPSNKAILERLEQDIRSDNQMDRWAAFALEDLIRPPYAVASETIASRWARNLELVRNALLFLPVMLTWFAIDYASSAYNLYISGEEAGQSEKLSFLQIWLDEERLKSILWFKPTLQTIAKYDAFLILTLVVLTLVVHVLDQKAEKISRETDLKNDLDLRNVMVDVGLFLHGFRQITPSQLKSGLSEAVNSLARATESIRDTSSGLKDVADAAHLTLAKFADLSTRELEPAAKRIDLIVGSLGVAVDAHTGMGDMVRNLQRDLGQSLEVITKKMDLLGSVLDSLLSDNTEKLEVAMRGIIQETNDVAQRLASASSAAHEVVELMRERAR